VTVALLAALLAASPAKVEPGTLVFAPEPAAIELTIPGADSIEARVVNGAGTLSPPSSLGDGRFKTQLTFPAQRFPQVALLLVEAKGSGGRKRHWLALPLLANANLKIETKPSATVTVSIGELKYGPATADARGRLNLPAKVPPGFAKAEVVAVDRAGNSTTSALDLSPVPFVRSAAILVKERANPDEPVELEVYAVESDGRPLVDAAQVKAFAARGSCDNATRKENGIFVVTYRAPKDIAEGKDVVTVSVGDSPGQKVEVPLSGGGAAKVVIELSAPSYVAGSGTRVGVKALVKDAHGNPAPGLAPAVKVDFGTLEETPAGPQLVLPDKFGGRKEVQVRATAAGLSGEATLALVAGPPVKASLKMPANVQAGAQAEGKLEATDQFGNTVAPDAVAVESKSGQRATLAPSDDGNLKVAWEAPKDGRSGDVELEVRAGEMSLTRAAIEVLPYERPWAINVGAFITGAHNFGQASSFGPRVSLGLRFGRSGFELGLEGAYAWHPPVYPAALENDPGNDVTFQANAWQLALAARYTLRLASLLSLHLAASVGGQYTAAKVTIDGQDPMPREFWSPLIRGAVGAGLHVAIGRIVLQLEYAYAQPPTGVQVKGNLGGLGLALGYVAAF
jgi:hypothetical protein